MGSRFVCCLLAGLVYNITANAADSKQAEWVPLEFDAAAAPTGNPLKGFLPYLGGGDAPLEHSMEFTYVPLNALMDGPDSFTFDSGLEPILEDAASRGRQLVLRVYIDYPDPPGPETGEPFGLPAFLDGQVALFPYDDPEGDGSGMSPDYDDPDLVAALTAFIAEFGRLYDDDARIGFIQLGLLGHWGEWHTTVIPDKFAGLDTQNAILDAYDAAFNERQLLVSQDVLGQETVPAFAGRNIGFHDDNVPVETISANEDYFWNRMEAFMLDELWKTAPIGGEMQPAYEDFYFDNPGAAEVPLQDYDEVVDTIHASWFLYDRTFSNDWTPVVRARAEAGSRRLGYAFTVTEARLGDIEESEPLTLAVRIENRGVAPFYYAWPFEIAAMDGTKQEASWTPPWDLRSVLPGEPPAEFSFEVADHGLGSGTYSIGLRIPNPMPGGRAVKFANAEQEADWLVLGTITVGEGGNGGSGGSTCGMAAAKDGVIGYGDAFGLAAGLIGTLLLRRPRAAVRTQSGE